MVANFTGSSNISALIAAINNFPQEWALTPCVGKKNLWPNWNQAKLDHARLIEAIRSQTNHEGKPCKWTGVSLVSGPLSGGIMAIDYDGPLALQKYLDLSAGELPPTTMRWTSGKLGHFQILLSVPPDKWKGIGATKFFILHSKHRVKLGLSKGEVAIQLETTEENISLWESGSKSPVPPQLVKKLAAIYGVPEGELVEKLELRWNECSTLPPSMHPGTEEPYFWENQGAIAECPDFILDLMPEAPAIELPQKPKPENLIPTSVDEKSLVDILEAEILPRLDAEEFYGSYTKLKTSGKNLKGLCPLHQEKTPSFTVSPDTKLFKCFGCDAGGGPMQFLHQIGGGSGSPTGKDFYSVVRELADRVGVRIGDRKSKQNPASSIQKPKPSNILKHPAVYEVESPAEEIIERADKILADELTPTNNLISAISEAKRAGLSPRDFREILQERQAEQSLDFSILDSISRLKQLHQIQNTPINLREFFPSAIATALLSKAESDRIDPVRILQSFLPLVGTMLGSRVGIELKRGDEDDDAWVEYPIFYTTDIGYPSTGKSATQDSLIKPLQKMQDEEQERLDEALIELTQVEEAWKELSKEEKAKKAESDENPRIFQEKYCKPKKWLFDEASAQALTKRIAEQESKHGCLLLQDELAGLFDSMDQFTGGKGGQRQFLLKAWNKPLKGSVDRVDVQSSYFFRSQSLNITGTIQPDVARRIFNVASDPDGMLSRFLPAIAGIPDNFSQRPTVRVSLNRMMKDLIQNLERLPETLLTLPSHTADVYWDYWEKLRRGQQINFGDSPGYSYFLGKQLSYVGRFAIVLHCLENLGASEIPSRVTPETMNKAVRLSLFYCNQFLLLQSKSAQQQPIEGILLDILKFAREKGGQISTRDLCRSRFQRTEVGGKKLTSSTAAKLLKGIADAGFGFYEECGNSRILRVLSSVSSDCHQTVINIKTSDSKDLSADCHQMTEVCISKISDRTENVTEVFIEESGTSTPVENIQFCHLMTVGAENHEPQALEADDSLMTVDDIDDSAAILDEGIRPPHNPRQTPVNISATPVIDEPAPTPPIAPMMNWNVGDRVKVSAEYVTHEYRGERATVVKVWPDGLCRIELDREISVIEGKPKKQFNINGRYLVSEKKVELNEDELDFVKWIREAIAQPDTDTARETVADILPILKNLCANGKASREKLWAALTDSERAIFSELTVKPIALSDNSQEPEPPQPAPEPEIIAPADAEKMRDIALVWWPEMYPEALQSLVAQMFGWGAPAHKYSAVQIALWLQGEDHLVKYRIGELMAIGLADKEDEEE
jgi:transcriptional regulator with XRE-family HTH domain